MGFLTESNEVGNIGLKKLREQREVISKRWEKIGLLEGLNGNVRENIAQLFENQLNYLKESTGTEGSNGAFETIAFPVIRRVFSKLLANEIVSIQAMQMPIGRLFYINPKISVRKSDGSHYEPDGAYRNAATTPEGDRVQFEDRSLYDAYYATEYDSEGTSLFDRSKGSSNIVTGQAIPKGTVSAGIQPGRMKVAVSGVTETHDGKLKGARGSIMDTESFLASLKIVADQEMIASGETEYSKPAGATIPFRVVTQEYGKSIVNENGQVELELLLTYPGKDGYTPFSTSGDPSFSFAYKTYNDMEEDAEMAEVSFDIESVTVSVESRKMRASWTPELSQDLYSFLNIDAESELTALLSEQVAAEIDREILRDLRRVSAWVTQWDYKGFQKQSGTYFGVQKDWNQTLITEINKISSQIHKATLRGGASWLVVSPEIAAVFNDLEYFHASMGDVDDAKFNMGIEKIGTLSNRYKVYVDPFAPANTLLIGTRGNSILEAGYIYAPYVPLELTPVMHDPASFRPIRGLMTRYGKKVVNNRYYGKILVDGLTVYGLGELR